MAELANCSRCGAVFVKHVRSICQACYNEEEKAFEKVYRFLSVQRNREATIQEIVKATSVGEDLIIKFMKEKRLRVSQFPNLFYPCEKCGTAIRNRRLCETCSKELKQGWQEAESKQATIIESQKKQNTYYTLVKTDKKP